MFRLVQSISNVGKLQCPCHEPGTLRYLRFCVAGDDDLHIQLNTECHLYLVGFGDNPLPGKWLSKVQAMQKVASHYGTLRFTLNQNLGDLYAPILSK